MLLRNRVLERNTVFLMSSFAVPLGRKSIALSRTGCRLKVAMGENTQAA
jgi:hypothetical protein